MKTNFIYNDDNHQVLQTFPDECIDLTYIDPPFNTGRKFQADSGGYADNAEKFRETAARLTPDWKWLEQILTEADLVYYATMIPRLKEICRVTRPTGALYYHCDWRTSATMRLVLNQIWHPKNFRNEIAWVYPQVTALYDKIEHRYRNEWDSILFYAKPHHQFTPQYFPLTAQQIKKEYPYRDSQGRKYRNKNIHGERQYAEENRGKKIGTAWSDIPIVKPKERTGYPTQKPLALLHRIIDASSNEGDNVLDCYCGSGTTLLAAKASNRNYIGIDENPEACAIAQRRLDGKR